MVSTVIPEEIPGYACDLVADAIDTSGFPIVLSEDSRIGYDERLVIASRDQPYHEVVYTPAFRPHRLHFLVNACVKIKRLFDVPAEDRLVPVSDADRRLPREDEAEITNLLPGMPSPLVEQMSRFLYRGLVGQAASMPLDIRVERDIAAQFPEHAEHQRVYLSRQLTELVEHIDPLLGLLIPTRVYAAASAMNVALATEAADLIGVELDPVFHSSPHAPAGLRLRDEVARTKESGCLGDRLLVDRWARVLGLENWYEWRTMDAVQNHP